MITKNHEQLNQLFFEQPALNENTIQKIATDSLHGMDDGELYLEYCQSESISFDDGRIKNTSFNIESGFGLRAVLGDKTGYAYSSELSESAVKRAANAVSAIKLTDGFSADLSLDTRLVAHSPLYTDLNPINELEFNYKVKLLGQIDNYLRSKNPLVKQVSASISAEWQAIMILTRDGNKVTDVRPLIVMNISVVVEKDGRMESGSNGAGGRISAKEFINEDQWKKQADDALRQALVNLDAKAAPAGEMMVVLGSGWPGILLHEAVGHGLEGDFNRKKTSAFSDLLGKRVAAPGVTVIDDGTIPDRRGSLTIDDEGTPTSKTVLIEDGILKNYLQDRMNARLMGMKATGNGRRESFACQPMPRMTNTFMLAGGVPPEEIISSVKNGLYAVNFAGGQVDITTGKFVFSASESYLIENGKITRPVKGATLIGNGPDILTKVALIGNDLQLDPGIGTCGKAGQSVPVGVGQPTLLISAMTVGGTEV